MHEMKRQTTLRIQTLKDQLKISIRAGLSLLCVVLTSWSRTLRREWLLDESFILIFENA